MNTAARIESKGEKDRIHLSQETADLVKAAGKGHWLKEREDVVIAKGKGELKTFWLVTESAVNEKSGNESQVQAQSSEKQLPEKQQISLGSGEILETSVLSDKLLRLVNWNTEILARLLREIVARRDGSAQRPDPIARVRKLEIEQLRSNATVLEEVEDVIILPDYDGSANARDASKVELSQIVVSQLNEVGFACEEQMLVSLGSNLILLFPLLPAVCTNHRSIVSTISIYDCRLPTFTL